MYHAQRRKGAKKNLKSAVALCAFAPLRERLFFFVDSLLAVLFITSVSARVQDDDVIRTTTDNVVLNITVTDKDGQYV